jgi:hypothetical protein
VSNEKRLSAAGEELALFQVGATIRLLNFFWLASGAGKLACGGFSLGKRMATNCNDLPDRKRLP